MHPAAWATISRAMTASEIRDLLATTLVRRSGGTRRDWRLVVGPVRVHDAATHAHCNWSVEPSGSAREVDEVERLLDQMRLSHPIVTAG